MLDSEDLKKLKEVFFEVEHLFEKDQKLEIVVNTTRLNSITNTNFKMFNYVVRLPEPSIQRFFNRSAEISNIKETSKQLEMTNEPLYFNVETGVMVNRYTSPEIYFERKFLNFDTTDSVIQTMNRFNGSGLVLQEAFDYNDALAMFRTKELTSKNNMEWLIDYYNRQVLQSEKLEPSHNDPDVTNFTVTGQLIDFEFSGMAPHLSDISNFYSMYFYNTEVDGYIRNLDLPQELLQPQTIFWTFFWSMWALSKEKKTIKNRDYIKNARRNLIFANELLTYHREKLR